LLTLRCRLECASFAAYGLGEVDVILEPLPVIDALSGTLSDAHPNVRERTAWALGEIEHPTAVSGLVSALNDEDWEVRKNAAWALGEIEDPSAIDALRAAAKDSNNQVRRAVDYALGELGDKRRRRR
jgi:HEAT repeat protein